VACARAGHDDSGRGLRPGCGAPSGSGEAIEEQARMTGTPLAQATEACEIARQAFAVGDHVTGIAALTVAAQLVQLARIFSEIEEARKA
jgi:hypothetical protein